MVKGLDFWRDEVFDKAMVATFEGLKVDDGELTMKFSGRFCNLCGVEVMRTDE